MRRYFQFVLLATISLPGLAVAESPDQVFNDPPEAAKLGCYWTWMGRNLSKEGITRDMEAMKAAGFGDCTMMNPADTVVSLAVEIENCPTPELVGWSEPWWKLVRHAAEEAKRLKMGFGMFNGTGYTGSGGPWITPEFSMQDLCFSQTDASGGQTVSLALSRPVVDPKPVISFPPYWDTEKRLPITPDCPARNSYFRDIAVLAVPQQLATVTREQIINLSDKMTPEGKLIWDAPVGNWTIYRFGHTTRGSLVMPVNRGASGFECDKMSKEAVAFHMDHVIGDTRKHLGDLVGSNPGFTHIHFDSYEAGKANWTPKMREEFSKRRNYDLTPFLLTFAGRIVGSQADTDKFRVDFEATIRNLYEDNYFPTIKEKLHAAKLEFPCEPYYGPWDMMKVVPNFDRPMAEFWTHFGRYTPTEVDTVVAAARAAGKNLIEAEAFTSHPDFSQWTETPAWLKPIGDAAYCAGINRFVLHTFVHQPWDDRFKPGTTYGQWGTQFNRNQTWWKPAKAMTQYWLRCQALLQWGKFAAPEFQMQEATAGMNLQGIHRSDGDVNIWFVANLEHAAGTAKGAFHVAGKQPELWDPVTGTMKTLCEYEVKDGQTIIPLTFAPTQSLFVVFREKSAEKPTPAAPNFPVLKPVREITGSWDVGFDPKWGGPEKVTFDKLEDWTARPENGIRYYSGTAVYQKTFDGNAGCYLDLGVVRHIARVKLNGNDLGVVWCPPWGIAIPSGLLKAENNQLTIEVTNVWANRLIGDEQEPPDCGEWLLGLDQNKWVGRFMKRFPDWFVKGEPRPSKGRYCFTTWNYFTKDSPSLALIPSGLLGPVRLMSE